MVIPITPYVFFFTTLQNLTVHILSFLITVVSNVLHQNLIFYFS